MATVTACASTSLAGRVLGATSNELAKKVNVGEARAAFVWDTNLHAVIGIPEYRTSDFIHFYNRQRSLVPGSTWRLRHPAILQRKGSCRCNLGDQIPSQGAELHSYKELSPKELHHLRKKKERKVLRKLKKELQKKKSLELAKLHTVRPKYAMLRFQKTKTLECWNKPRKKKVAVSPPHDAGIGVSRSGEGNRGEELRCSVTSWSQFEAVYRDHLLSSKDETTGEVSGLYGSDSYQGESKANRNSSEICSVRNDGGIDEGRTGYESLEQGWKTFNGEELRAASYRKNVVKVVVGERNGSPVYLSTEGDDGKESKNLPRDYLDEQKQLEWLARQLDRVRVRTDGVHFSRLMRSGGLKITGGRAIILLQLLGARGNWRRAMQVVEWLNTRHQYPSMKSRYVYTTLLAVLGRTRRPSEALKVFKCMCDDAATYPDMAAYHSVAVTLGQAGFLEELLDLIPTLRRGPKITKCSLQLENSGVLYPDVIVFNGVLNACASRRDWKCALWVLTEIRKQKLQPTSASYGLAIEAMVRAGKLNLAFETLEKMEADFCHPNSCTYRVLVEGLGRAGRADTAVALVKRMEQRGIVPSSGVYFALGAALCRCGRWKEAILQVGRLVELSDKPLVETYTGLITACEKGGHWQDAISVFQFMLEVCSPNIGTYNFMIALYGRHHLFSESKNLFNRLIAGRISQLTPDKFTYNAMLGACALCGEWQSLESTYRHMLLQGYELESKRHSWILKALGEAGKHDLVESAGSRILSKNETVTSELYQIMICSCISVGRHEEVFSYLEKMVKQAMSINTKQHNMFQEVAYSLSDVDRHRFVDLVDLLQVSSDFPFKKSDKSVTSADQSLYDSDYTCKELRVAVISDEERGRTSYRKEDAVIPGDRTHSLTKSGSSYSSDPDVREEGSGEDSRSPVIPAKARKQRKLKKPVNKPDPELPGWELLWTSSDQEHMNQLDLSLFR